MSFSPVPLQKFDQSASLRSEFPHGLFQGVLGMLLDGPATFSPNCSLSQLFVLRSILGIAAMAINVVEVAESLSAWYIRSRSTPLARGRLVNDRQSEPAISCNRARAGGAIAR